MIHAAALAPNAEVRVTCPACNGVPYRLMRGATWGYAGGSPDEYASCRYCDGEGKVTPEEAEECPDHLRGDD